MIRRFLAATALATAGLSLILAPLPARTAPKPPPSYPYRCISLGTLGGDYSMAQSVNDAGEVVGWSDTVRDASINLNHDERAFYWKDADGDGISDPGEMVFLGSYGYNSGALSITGQGEAVGWSKYSNLNALDERAVLWDTRTNPPTMTDLNSLLSPGDQANWTLQRAYAINENRKVAIIAIPTTDRSLANQTWQRAVLLDLSATPPVITDLGLPAEVLSFPRALNNLPNPQVAGQSNTSSASGWRWAGGNLLSLPSFDRGLGINDAGAIVGSLQVAGVGSHPSFWTDTNDNGAVDPAEVVDLGVMGTYNSGWSGIGANAINNSGTVVGTTWGAKLVKNRLPPVAFRWQAGASASTKQDLNSLTAAPFELKAALDVSEGGNIVGYGDGTGTYGAGLAFLLKPAQ